MKIPVYKSFSDMQILSLSLRSLVDTLVRTETALGDMKNQAHRDQLTGLPNRAALEIYLENTIMDLDPEHEALSFMYLDLDGFKRVNDTLGHQTGDILLQKVASRLREAIPARDIVVRLGGDEFLIILRSGKDEAIDAARTISHRIIESINSPFIIDLNHVTIGCSMGVSFYPIHDRDVGSIIRLADESLYQSKQSGKNRVTFYPHEDIRSSDE